MALLTDRFHPVRVLEVGEGLSGAFAGLILATLGYEVVQVRAGLRRDLDDLESAFYDRGRIVAAGTGALEGLLPLTDVLLTDLHPVRMRELGLPCSEDDLAGIRTGLVEVAVTSFGLGGPHSEYAACDITDWAAGGLSYLTRRNVPRDDREHYSPVLPAGRQPEVLAGLAAAIGTLAALRLAGDAGRSVLADVSRQEVQASMSHSYLPMLLHNQILFGGPDTRTDFGWLVPASDGEVYIRTVETSQWDRLVEWMGSPDWAVRRPDELPLYYSAPELIAPLLGEWTGQHTKAWLLEEAVRRRVPVAPSREIAEVLSWAHLRYRNAWELVDTDGGSVTAPRVPLLETVFPGQAMATEQIIRRWADAG
jgi:crotonobetainyl-CoA:carnitine CoA-transferase CaiB-like acyl-CoA transferase